MKGYRRTLSLLLSVVMLTLLASVSIAGPGRFGALAPSDDVETTADESGDPCVEPTDGVEPTDEVDCVEDEPTDEESSADPQPQETDPATEREAACMEAAGIEPSEGETDGEETKAHGLDKAIERVFANCVKNPQAPGSLNALERLAANRERHEAHEAWKAERKAEREAAKAEREAAKDERNSDKSSGARGHGNNGDHGNSGDHGNPHDGGSNGSHSNGNSK